MSKEPQTSVSDQVGERTASGGCSDFFFQHQGGSDPAGGAYSAPRDPLAGFKGPTSKGKGGSLQPQSPSQHLRLSERFFHLKRNEAKHKPNIVLMTGKAATISESTTIE